MTSPTRRSLLAFGGTLIAAGCAQLGDSPPPPEAQGSGASADPDAEVVSEALGRLNEFKDLRAGGPGDVACGNWMEENLQLHGFSTSRQAFETPYFEPSIAWLRAGSIEAPVYPQGIVVPTGSAGVTGPLKVWRAPGDVADPAGGVVLMVLPHARHSQLAHPALKSAIRPISDGGAAAIILVTSGPSGERIALNANPTAPAWPTPMAVIGPRDAEALYALARQGAEATLVTDGAGGTRPAFNLIGELNRPGPRIVISTPRSGWGPCMGERGPGIAVFTALARTLPTLLPEHALTFVATSGHEYDNLGSHHFIAAAAPRPESTKLWCHLGAGFAARDWHELGGQLLPLKNADPQRFLVASQRFLPVLRENFAGISGLELPYPAQIGPEGELGEIISAGYPDVFGMLGAHRFHHAPNDTADKTGPELILPVLKAVRSSLLQIA